MAIPGITGLGSGIGPVARPEGVVIGGIDSGARTDQPFSKMMNQMLGEVQQSQQKMDHDVTNLATGQAENVHEIVLNVAQADLMFRLVLEVRDKLIASYQDVMRMQI
ncbi:MAG TPA: flagellar hook-basal body complex protein FliE [Caulifigura sp.]|jgi:flagellar hook-basal body complex protein FliE|nr:flagellar hook-basal body complex protein FliE [Caulifigura sp.]